MVQTCVVMVVNPCYGADVVCCYVMDLGCRAGTDSLCCVGLTLE